MFQHLVSKHWVLLDNDPLIWIKGAWFVEDSIGDTHLSNIV